ncbi:hypothetical protein [Pseudomonas soli]|uniref:hypothetical protein n=1 Tax=Pseudomonas soli TaxID=1306993 RepID=UPI00345CEA9A
MDNPTINTKATPGDGNVTLPGHDAEHSDGPKEDSGAGRIDPISLHAMPLVIGRHTIQAYHTAWGLPPLYSLNEIRRATPGASFEVAQLQEGLVADPDLFTEDLHGVAAAARFLTERMRALGELGAENLPENWPWDKILADHEAKAQDNRKAVNTVLEVTGRSSWAIVRRYVEQAATYTGPVHRPCWDHLTGR